jgi:predicted Zn-dependent protease
MLVYVFFGLAWAVTDLLRFERLKSRVLWGFFPHSGPVPIRYGNLERNRAVYIGMVLRSLAPLALLCFLGCPVPANADMFKPGVKDQIALGKRAVKEIRKEDKVLPDDDYRVREVRRLGDRLVSLIPAEERKKKPFEYSFNVIDSKELNAFALPGGPVFVYSGLLDKLDTEDEIVGILAHELTHVRNEHWASAYADSQKRQLGLMVILTVINANDTLFNAASISDTLIIELPYSRKHEQEADNVGYQLASNAHYNPQGMIDVFQILLKAPGGKGGRSKEWISDHPALETRIQKIKDRIAREPNQFPAETPRERRN